MLPRVAATAAILAMCVWAAGQPAPGPAPAPKPVNVTSQSVQQAVAKAVAFLYSQQDAQGSFPNPPASEFAESADALAAYALLQAGQSPQDDRLKKLLACLKGQQVGLTYARGLRLMALAGQGEDYRKTVMDDLTWLLAQQQKTGGWGFGPQSQLTIQRPEWTDGSNSCLAVMALREAADAGLTVPIQNWSKAENYFKSFQNTDGGWGLQPAIGPAAAQKATSYGTMTAAGLVVYYTLADKLAVIREQPYEPGKTRFPGELGYADRITKGHDWLAKNYDVAQVPGYVWVAQPGQLYHYLFLLERAAGTAGARNIGPGDLAGDVAKTLMAGQAADGSWNKSVVDTSFALLALSQARRPVVVSRLQLGKSAGDPRDAANLARWMSRNLGQPTGWQAFGPSTPAAYADGRLVYLNAAEADLPTGINDDFRKFIAAGGLCLVQAPAGAPKYVDSLLAAVKKVFPDYQLKQLPADHAIWNARFPIETKLRPAVAGIGDGCRTPIYVLTDDLAGAFHQGLSATYPQHFQLAANLVVMSGGGQVPPDRFAARGRGAAPAPKKAIKVARLKYDGDYSACPAAADALSAELVHSLSAGVKDAGAVAADQPLDKSIRMLWLTGTKPPKFSDAEINNLREYLAGGGSLLIDGLPGRDDFSTAGMAILAKLAGGKESTLLPAGSPVITGKFAGGLGSDLSALTMTTPTGQSEAIQLWSVGPDAAQPAAFLSSYGLLCAADASPGNEKSSCSAEQARKILLNLLLFGETK